MLQNFDFSLNIKFVFSKDADKRIGSELIKKGVKRVLIHHDSGRFLYDSGLLKQIISDLEQNSIQVFELGGVQPNPRLNLVYEGIGMVKEKNIDFVLAIGGGSSIDSAKAIAAGALFSGDVWEFYSSNKTVENALPIGVVLTYPATGSESSNVSVINNTEIQEKKLTSSSVLRPSIVFMNPQLTYSLPPILTAYGIVDMFSHVCERYFAPNQEVGVIDRMAEGILKTLVELGPKVLKDPNNYDYRSEIMWIGTIAHNDTVGIGRIQDWGTHVIGNELSALYDTPHGATLSIIMGSWMRYVYKNDIKRFARYAVEVFGIENDSDHMENVALKGIESTERFFQTLHMPISFSDAKVPINEFEKMVDKINFTKPNHTIGRFMELTRDDVIEILRMAQ